MKGNFWGLFVEGVRPSSAFSAFFAPDCGCFGFLWWTLAVLGGVNGLHYCPLVKTLHLHSFQKSRQLQLFHHHCHPYHQFNTTIQEEGMLHTKENIDLLAKFLELLDRGQFSLQESWNGDKLGAQNLFPIRVQICWMLIMDVQPIHFLTNLSFFSETRDLASEVTTAVQRRL